MAMPNCGWSVKSDLGSANSGCTICRKGLHRSLRYRLLLIGAAKFLQSPAALSVV